MNEVWKDIPGYPGYQASDLGNIRYLLRWKRPRVLTPGTHTGGYLKVGVTLEGKTRTILAHRLIALAFIPNPQQLPQVNHLNANKADNRPMNLEWVSSDQNVAHAKRNRLY